MGRERPPRQWHTSAHQPAPLCRSGRQKKGGRSRPPPNSPISTTEPRFEPQQRGQKVREKCPCTSKDFFRAHAPLCPMCTPRSARNLTFQRSKSTSRKLARTPDHETCQEDDRGGSTEETGRRLPTLAGQIARPVLHEPPPPPRANDPSLSSAAQVPETRPEPRRHRRDPRHPEQFRHGRIPDGLSTHPRKNEWAAATERLRLL